MTTFSLWDTFRAAHPLYTIIQTKRIHDMAASMMAFYRESGLLPEWSLMANETNTMIGYHAVPVLFDAYNKGFIENPEEVYVAMKKSAQQKRFGIEYIDKYGYVPGDLVTESTSKTLEYAYDDWCIAGMAKALGHEEDYSYYSKRAQNYKNVFDPSVGFMRGRLSDGGWRSPFAPNKAEHRKGDFTEGNSWQYSWFVPHNVSDLINLMGGAERFVERLDSLFSISSDVGTEASPDVSGLIGQYAHGNEPSHHIAYLFAMAGYPEKTQEILHRIMTTLYSNKTDGLCGNEDCGQMSAWYVLSVLGFYPVNPASGQYIFGRPFLQEAQIHLNNGKTFVIKTKNLTSDSIYIRSVTLNGKSWNKGNINHSDIINGGELVFEMSNSPNKH
jgi:predicted alpha-1,2-mannosidase